MGLWRALPLVRPLTEIALALRDQLIASTVLTRSSMPAPPPLMLAVGAAAAETSRALPEVGMHAPLPVQLRELRASSFPGN
ncbi:hypothetical protein PF008_g12025 [Phytophthora fragariae]|uniref:Uncharacterized protein n=1 Tax=Phytophthora fragariae TaxID=53985 RepID=A0A6G0RPM0_9STRA|nr:hypothetical protein PF008_g12025 [Phytophthora fragariae]